jgi:hypothetical protein
MRCGTSVDLDRRAANYADNILNGVNPADLHVDQPRSFNSSSI